MAETEPLGLTLSIGEDKGTVNAMSRTWRPVRQGVRSSRIVNWLLSLHRPGLRQSRTVRASLAALDPPLLR